MPHNRFYLNDELAQQANVFIEDDELHHMVKVMRQRVGETVELVNGKGALAIAEILSIQKKQAELKITSVEKTCREQKGYTLSVALLKPASLELVCEKATELGACQINLFPADKSEKSHVSSHTLNRLHRHIRSALKQSGRLFLPTLNLLADLSCVFSIPSIYCDIDCESINLSAIPLSDPLTNIIIGPESGFSSSEKVSLKEKATSCRLHTNVLKAETAAITACALLADQISQKNN